jgi:lipopolysaccharide biosynthesis regulator YciM
MIAEEGKIVSGGNIVLLSQINTALAQAYLGKKDIGKATVAISEALKLSNNNNAYALEIQGDILRVTNDDAKALDLYMNLKSKGNNSRRLNQKLQLLKGN